MCTLTMLTVSPSPLMLTRRFTSPAEYLRAKILRSQCLGSIIESPFENVCRMCTLSQSGDLHVSSVGV